MKFRLLLPSLFFLLSIAPLPAATLEQPFRVGTVDFEACVEESKQGKQEQTSFDQMRQQMVASLEKTEKELTDISSQLSDADFVDGLSPEGEAELKMKFQTLNEQLNVYQQQYYQVLNQANMRMIHTMMDSVSLASETIAKKNQLNLILNEDACFFCDSKFDVTPLVIAEMDGHFTPETPTTDKPQTQAPTLK